MRMFDGQLTYCAVRIVPELTVVRPLLGAGGQLVIPDDLAHILGARLARIAARGNELPEAIVFLQDD